jgi:hypothetical protein
MPHPVRLPRWPRTTSAARHVTVLSLTLQAFGHVGSITSLGPLAVVASGRLVVGCSAYPVTIDDHAAARDWIAGTIAAIRPEGRTMTVFALRVYQPAALP